MPARPALVTQVEIKRTVAAARDAGIEIGRVDVDHSTGRVSIIPKGVKEDGANPCDRLLK